MKYQFCLWGLMAVLGGSEAASARMQALNKAKTEFRKKNHGAVKVGNSVRREPQVCTEGAVVVDGISYDCDNVDFSSLVSITELEVSREGREDSIFEMSDIWGWTSPSGREITISTMTNVLWFIDSTDPENPVRLGVMYSPRAESYWGDVKVYQNTAYWVQDAFSGSETNSTNGVTVFDLLRLEALPAVDSVAVLEPDYLYEGQGSTHNVVINPESGFLYSVGTEADDCNAGLHILDLSNRMEPTFSACAGEDGYVHDAQCVNYHGPDSRYANREMCFGFNEDTLTIYDVEDKSNIVIVGMVTYDTASYTHQGWLTEDMSYILMNDELDEFNSVVPNTRTYVVNLADLENPIVETFYSHSGISVDHNLYVWGAAYAHNQVGSGTPAKKISSNFVYHTNYVDGLRIVDLSQLGSDSPEFAEVGYFDTSPTYSGNQDWYGTWSSFMFPSGVVALNSIHNGVFFVKPRMVFEEEDTNGGDNGHGGTEGNDSSSSSDDDDAESILLGIVVVLALIVVVLVLLLLDRQKQITGAVAKAELAEEKRAKKHSV